MSILRIRVRVTYQWQVSGEEVGLKLMSSSCKVSIPLMALPQRNMGEALTPSLKELRVQPGGKLVAHHTTREQAAGER